MLRARVFGHAEIEFSYYFNMLMYNIDCTTMYDVNQLNQVESVINDNMHTPKDYNAQNKVQI